MTSPAEPATSWALTAHRSDDLSTAVVEGRAVRTGTAVCDSGLTVYDELTLRFYRRRAGLPVSRLDEARDACRRCYPTPQ